MEPTIYRNVCDNLSPAGLFMDKVSPSLSITPNTVRPLRAVKFLGYQFCAALALTAIAPVELLVKTAYAIALLARDLFIILPLFLVASCCRGGHTFKNTLQATPIRIGSTFAASFKAIFNISSNALSALCCRPLSSFQGTTFSLPIVPDSSHAEDREEVLSVSTEETEYRENLIGPTSAANPVLSLTSILHSFSLYDRTADFDRGLQCQVILHAVIQHFGTDNKAQLLDHLGRAQNSPPYCNSTSLNSKLRHLISFLQRPLFNQLEICSYEEILRVLRLHSWETEGNKDRACRSIVGFLWKSSSDIFPNNEILNLSGLSLSSLPATLSDIPIRTLNIGENNITALPPMRSLRTLRGCSHVRELSRANFPLLEEVQITGTNALRTLSEDFPLLNCLNFSVFTGWANHPLYKAQLAIRNLLLTPVFLVQDGFVTIEGRQVWIIERLYQILEENHITASPHNLNFFFNILRRPSALPALPIPIYISTLLNEYPNARRLEDLAAHFDLDNRGLERNELRRQITERLRPQRNVNQPQPFVAPRALIFPANQVNLGPRDTLANKIREYTGSLEDISASDGEAFELVHNINTAGGIDLTPFTNHQIDLIANWIYQGWSRLEAQSMFQGNNGAVLLAKKVLPILAFAAKRPEGDSFREHLTNALEEGTTSCTDRSLFYLNLLSISLKIYQAQNADDLLTALKSSYTASLTEEIWRDIIGHRASDYEELEVLLWIQKEYVEGACQRMTFEGLTRLSNEEKTRIREFMEARLHNPDNLVEYCSTQPSWHQYVEREYDAERLLFGDIPAIENAMYYLASPDGIDELKDLWPDNTEESVDREQICQLLDLPLPEQQEDGSFSFGEAWDINSGRLEELNRNLQALREEELKRFCAAKTRELVERAAEGIQSGASSSGVGNRV